MNQFAVDCTKRLNGRITWLPTLSRTDVIPSTPQSQLESSQSREARRIIDALHEAGFVAYLAGGCVRDALLGRQPKDYDVATDATPEAVRDLFGNRHTLAFGASFGVIGVLPLRNDQKQDQPNQNRPLEPTEVASFRSDGNYSDGRRPDSVHFGNAEQDALRRDFTINGLFYDPRNHQVIDYVQGQIDLKQKILRTIGDPVARFGEDKLRMLRAVRFATTLEFRIEAGTLAAIQQHASDIQVVSGERIGAEMRRVLASSNAAQGLQQLIQCGLGDAVLPEFKHVNIDRFRSLIGHASPCDFPLALACLLLDVPDPDDALCSVAGRWKLSNEENRMVAAALRHWPTVARAIDRPWSVVQPVLIDRDAATIVDLAAAVVAADNGNDDGICLARKSLKLPNEQLNPPPLITGNDLAGMGIEAGPAFRSILQAIRNAQLDKKISTPEQAIRMADEVRE